MPNSSRTMGAWIVAILLLTSGSVIAEPDDLQQAWMNRMTVSHRWDNVEGAPIYVQGARPGYQRAAGLHLVHLEPGDSVTLRIPEGESARARSPQKLLSGADLDFAWSNGSGLYLKTPVKVRGEGESLIGSAPGQRQTLLRITRPAHSGSPLDVALFVSRRLDGLVTTRYRNRLRPVAAGQTIRLLDQRSMTEYWSSDLHQPLTVEVEGPLRVEVQTRLLMPQGSDSIESYRAYTYLDDTLWRVLSFETALETRRIRAMGRCIGPMGRVATAYVEVPEGKHRLQLRVRRPMVARLVGGQQPDDYHFDGNRPDGYRQIAEDPSSRLPQAGFWSKAEPPADRNDEPPGPASALAYREALKVAENNGYQDGGLVAAMALQGWWPGFPAQASNRSMVARRLGLHTIYRQLMPEGGSGEAVYAWFETSRLQQTPATPPIIPESYTRPLLRALPSGHFFAVSTGRAGRLRYVLPERSARSYLRVAVERSRDVLGAALYVQFDDSEPFELRVREAVSLEAEQESLTTPGAALVLLQDRHQARGGTLSGPFAAQRRVAPQTTVGHLEIQLPASVRSITIWQKQASPSARVALAYRGGKTFSRSESDLMTLLEAIDGTKVFEDFSEMLRKLQTSAVAHDLARDRHRDPVDLRSADLEADLQSQWQPLMHLLRNKYLQFSADVSPPSPAPGDAAVLSSQVLEALRFHAAEASAESDWHRALETWGRVWRGSRGEIRDHARLGQAAALQQLGNAFLGERLQREVFLHGHSETSRQKAFARLLENRERAQDRNDVLTLVAARAVLDPQPGNLRQLAKALLDVGQNRNALLLLLALPQSERSPGLTLRASYLEGWWLVFDKALANLESETERHRWRGYRSQHMGDYGAALDDWGQMGVSGEALHDRLVRGLRIRAELDSIDSETRQQALDRWQHWQAEDLASGQYSGKPSAVKHSQGAVLIQGRHHGQVATAYRADFAKPLVVPVFGPTRLRITVRPLHPSAPEVEPINDWVNVWRGAEKEAFPIIDNRPSTVLAVVGKPELAVGRGTHFDYPVPAGYHELRLEPEHNPVAVEIKILRPELPLAVLPPLTPYTARAALEGRLGTRPPPATTSTDEPSAVEVSRRCSPIRLLRLAPGEHSVVSMPVQPTMELPSATWFDTQGKPTGGLTRTPRHGVAKENPVAHHESEDKARLNDLRHWLWLAEHDPEQRAQALAKAERTFAENPTTAGAETLMRRLRRGADWERVRTIQQSAGVRAIETTAWEPEHPALRIRKALMDPLQAGEQIVSGFDTLVMAVENTQRTRFLVELTSEDVGYQQTHEMVVFVAIDNQPEQQVKLSLVTPRVTLIEELGKGQRSLRVRIAQPMSNQYLRVRIKESRGDSQETVAERSQRFYDLATPAEPLVVYVDGPAWLRIDELNESGTGVSYRMVESGPQKVVLSPSGAKPETLYRIFRQVQIEERPRPALRPSVVSFESLDPPPLRLPDAPPQSQPAPATALALGGQEDGTWSAFTALVARRALNDEPDAGLGTDRFFSTGLGYRYFSERQETYYQSTLRVRWRDTGEPTLAFQQWVDVRRSDWPFDLDLAGSLFVQDSEAAATLRGRVSRQWRWGEKTTNRPSVSFFQRFLTLDDVSGNNSDEVDQDVFTTYKDNHKRGLRLGNLTAYRPSADTVLHARIGVTSNDDLNLFAADNVQLRLGSKQLFGDFTLGTGYSLTHYFADKNRARSANRSKFWIDVGYLGFWSPRDGAEAKLRVQYDAKAEDTSFWLSLGWNRSNGRYYRDFRPSDVDFIAQRNLRALEKESAPAVLDGLESM